MKLDFTEAPPGSQPHPKVMVVLDIGGQALAKETYLVDFDFEAFGGRGHAELTADIRRARRFENPRELLNYWRTISTVRPLRRDGKPNRPLTASTIMIVDAPRELP